jgi:hypothetical protein
VQASATTATTLYTVASARAKEIKKKKKKRKEKKKTKQNSAYWYSMEGSFDSGAYQPVARNDELN